MGSEWPKLPLSSLLEKGRSISYGIVQPGPNINDGVPIIRVKDIRGGRVNVEQPLKVAPEIEANYERTRLRGGELLLTLVGTVGEAAIAPKELMGWNVARAVAVIPVKKDVGAFWVKLALHAPEVRDLIQSRLNTTVQSTLNLRDVAQLPIVLPDLPERHRIAHILGTLDDKIELNRRQNEILEAIARAIFKSWFVDFDPARAKQAARERGASDEEVQRAAMEAIAPAFKTVHTAGGPKPDADYLRHLASLFPDRLVESEIGLVPEGWMVGKLKDVAHLCTKNIKPQQFPERIFEYYSIPAYDEGKVPVLEKGENIKSNKYLVDRDAVLVSKLNPITPRIWLPNVGAEFAICSTEFMQFIPKATLWRNWLYLLMRSENMQEQVLQRVTGSTGSRQRAQPKQIAMLPVMIPSEDLIRVFDVVVGGLLSCQTSNLEQIKLLTSLRDTLLPKLISGELRVPEAEAITEEVMA